jgi:uncharacterized OB-fold protein
MGDRLGRFSNPAQLSNLGALVNDYAKPLPRINPDNARFWESAHEGVLRLPRCGDCDSWHWPPGPVCPACFSERIVWQEAQGRGVISTWTAVHKAWFPAFERDIPYAVAQIELVEGVRITAGIIDCEPAALHVGMPVEVVLDRVTDSRTLPMARPIPR